MTAPAHERWQPCKCRNTAIVCVLVVLRALDDDRVTRYMRIEPCDCLCITLIHWISAHIGCAVKRARQREIGRAGGCRHDRIDRSGANQRHTHKYPEYDTTRTESAQRIWPSASMSTLYGR